MALLTQDRLDVLKAYNDANRAELDALQLLIDLNLGAPVTWPTGSQRDILERCTLIVWWLDINLACYPIGPNSTLMFGVPPDI